MDTDADPFDTEYVTGLASEEDESLLEADFQQVADNPLKGPLSPSSPKNNFPGFLGLSRADWALFTQLAVIPDAIVKTESVDTAVQEVTNVLIAAADLSIQMISSHSFQRYKPWWNADSQTAYKNQRKLWGIFRRYPTTENILAFKKEKANARRVRRQDQRQSWIRYVSSLTSSTSSKQL
ncbi:putative RNA-directed DNA polymerase from transposon X-element [Trichonephila clavipes]|uniref:Putative RNA-directed DNA polymerase from transposon X-element n=1 Tax=Trichonephila clavipes TaxID=2585209 RepID=A0A8X6WIE9_TRICX|nr:putative RNA-directed DNA polymerase from transposon X-element [Trichonephila clavipes]